LSILAPKNDGQWQGRLIVSGLGRSTFSFYIPSLAEAQKGVSLLPFSVRRFCNTRNIKNETSSHPMSYIYETHSSNQGGMVHQYTPREKQPSAFHLVTLNFADSLTGEAQQLFSMSANGRFRRQRAKIVQTENNTKQKVFFVFIVEAQPISARMGKDNAF